MRTGSTGLKFGSNLESNKILTSEFKLKLTESKFRILVQSITVNKIILKLAQVWDSIKFSQGKPKNFRS